MNKEEAKKILEEAVIKELWKIIKEQLMKQRPCYLNQIDLSKVPVDKLRKKYVDYKFHHFWGGVVPPFRKIAEDKEGNRISEDAKVVADRLSLKYQLDHEWQIEVFDGENSIPVICAIADINENLKMVEDDMDMVGYFVGHRKTYEENGMKWQILQFEPLYPQKNNDDIRKYQYAYHWTPLYNLESIRKNGFLPKSENDYFSYPPRVYFLTGGLSPEEIDNMGFNLFAMNNDKRNNGEYAKIEINTEIIPKNVKFYYDPNMKDAMYTYDAIPSTTITKISTCKFRPII